MKRFSLIINHTSEDSHSAVLSSWDVNKEGHKTNIEAQVKTHKDVFMALNSMMNFVNKRLAPIDTTPPPPTYMGIEIPDKFLWVFPDNKFILEGFEIPLQYGAVDVAYFQWQAFRDCLDNGNHEFLKRALMGLWDYVAEQAEQQNFIQL